MPECISRRRFLIRLAVLSGAAAMPASAVRAGSTPAWVSLGPADKFGKEDFTRVVLPKAYREAVIYVTQQADGSYLALAARCTHQGCTVDWGKDDRRFTCPCHDGRYDETGRNIAGPPPRPLPRLPTKLDARGNLSVQAPA